MFSSEQELVKNSLSFLINEFNYNNNLKYIEEPKGLFGRPDVILFNGKIISIEYKLKNWKQAMKQAYRYQSFSQETYVLLDIDFATMAKENLAEFKKFNIGLGAVDNDKIEFYFKPKFKQPFSDKLMKKAVEMFED